MVFRAQSHTEISSMSFHPLPSRSRPAAVVVAGICTGGSSTSGLRSPLSSRSTLWLVGYTGAGCPSTDGTGDEGPAGDGVVVWYIGNTDGTGDAGVGGLARGAGRVVVDCRCGWARGVGCARCGPRCICSAGGDGASSEGHIDSCSRSVTAS